MRAVQLDQITQGLKSVQLDDEDASKYFINYISDETDPLGNDQSESVDNAVHEPTDELDVSALPNSLIVTPVPPQLFTDQQMKVIDSHSALSSTRAFVSLHFRTNSNKCFASTIHRSSCSTSSSFNVFASRSHLPIAPCKPDCICTSIAFTEQSSRHTLLA